MENKGLTLIGSYPSPFVRSLRLFMHERISFTFKSIDYLQEKDAQYLLSINPINKIPVLLHDEKVIFDSRVIYQYLKKEFLIYETLSLEEENLLSEIYGVMDTTINLFMMKRFDIDIHGQSYYFERNHSRIKNILHHISSHLELLSQWKFPAMLLYSYLDWANFRGMLKLNDFDKLNQFHQAWTNLQSVQATKIPS